MSVFSRNVCSFNTVNVHAPDKSTEILAWLSPLEQRIRHNDISSCRVPNVGNWLLQTDEFRNWRGTSCQDKSKNTTFFCYGNPGIGKTYITSLVVDALGEQASEKNIAVACFYFDFAAQKEQSPADMLGALLRQVVSGLTEIPGEVVNTYNNHKRVAGGRRPRLPEILKMLQTVSTLQPIFICVDALDECVAEYRQVVLESLQKILEKSPRTRLFITGRSYIRGEIQLLLAETVTFMNIKPNERDVITYILAQLKKDTNKGAMNGSLRGDILAKVPEMFSEIFLLVSLVVEAILKEQKVSTRRERLKAMTNGSMGAYDGMLSRIRAQGEIKEGIGMGALMWLSHSERPLRVDELCHALGVEIGSAALDPDNVPSIETLSDCCQGLLAVDKEASTVRLIHSTLKYYLSNHPDFVDRAHSAIAETCLTYLNFQQFKGPPTSNLSDLARTPLLGYSSIYWGAHAKIKLSGRAKSLALELFGDYNDHISAKLLLMHISDPGHFDHNKGFSSFTGLHCASFFGIAEVVAGLMNGCDVDQIDCVGNTPLMWAIQNGHEGVVELLRERGGVTLDIPCRSSHTPPLRATIHKRKRAEEPPPEPTPETPTGDLRRKRHRPSRGL